MGEAIMDLTKVLIKLQPVMMNCQLVADELPELLFGMRALTVEKVKDNFADHKREIQMAMLAASQHRANKDWNGFGEDIGSALRMVIDIEGSATTTLPSTAPATTSSTPGAVTTENSTILV